MSGHIYNNYICTRCRNNEEWGCNASISDYFMCDRETGEIIDDAARFVDCLGDECIVCERMASYLGEVCEDGLYHESYITTADTCEHFTHDYAFNNLYRCDDCGEWFYWADALRNFRGGVYCTECIDNYSVINSYHSGHYSFSPIGGTWEDKLIGFELEVDGLDDYREEAAMDVYDAFGDSITIEEDCSLYEGFEIISQPHTLEALRAFDFEELCDIPLERGAYSSPCSAGFHMHFSRCWFGDSEREQKITLYHMIHNYYNNWDALVNLSTRGDGSQIANYADITIPREDDDIVTAVYRASRDRYRALNLTNNSTIEFRLGSGTLDPIYLRSWIDLHVQMIEACKQGHHFIVNDDYSITITDETEAVA